MKTMDIKKKVENTLKKFKFVQWDRFTADSYVWKVYGWIDRKDLKKDFIVLVFDGTEDIDFITSSAKYDKEIKKILDIKRGLRCKRIEHYFNIKNSIKL